MTLSVHSNNVIDRRQRNKATSMLQSTYKAYMNFTEAHIPTLSIKIMDDLAVRGLVKIETPTYFRHKPKIYPISDLIANHKAYGLVPVNISRRVTSKKSVSGVNAKFKSATSSGCALESLGSSADYTTFPVDDNNSAPDRSKTDKKGLDTAIETPSNKRWTKFTEVKNRMVNTLQNKKMKLLPKVAPVHIIATQRTVEIGSEEVVVNILPDDIAPGSSSYIETYAVYTPENYEETFAYFEKITENRKQLFRAIYCLGDMLLADELDGDADDWKQYTERAGDEVRAWRKKCNRSNDIFEKTGRVMEYDDTKKSRFTLAIKKMFSWCCPCQ